eukprot:scaffold78963_cov18-Tisochrysis_lutea.AAC.1
MPQSSEDAVRPHLLLHVLTRNAFTPLGSGLCALHPYVDVHDPHARPSRCLCAQRCSRITRRPSVAAALTAKQRQMVPAFPRAVPLLRTG